MPSSFTPYTLYRMKLRIYIGHEATNCSVISSGIVWISIISIYMRCIYAMYSLLIRGSDATHGLGGAATDEQFVVRLFMINLNTTWNPRQENRAAKFGKYHFSRKWNMSLIKMDLVTIKILFFIHWLYQQLYLLFMICGHQNRITDNINCRNPGGDFHVWRSDVLTSREW